MMEGADRLAVGRTVVGEEQRAQPLVLGLVLASLSLIARAAVISRHENDNRLLELVVFLATIAAAIGYLSQLGPSTGEVANCPRRDIPAPAGSSVRARAPCGHSRGPCRPSELARVVADQIEDPRPLLILDVGERVERRLVSALIGKSARFIVEILLGRRRGMTVDARLRLTTPHQTVAAVTLTQLFFAALYGARRALPLLSCHVPLLSEGGSEPLQSASAKARLAATASPSQPPLALT
jgi:hypothetical protein